MLPDFLPDFLSIRPHTQALSHISFPSSGTDTTDGSGLNRAENTSTEIDMQESSHPSPRLLPTTIINGSGVNRVGNDGTEADTQESPPKRLCGGVEYVTLVGTQFASGNLKLEPLIIIRNL